MAALQPVSQLKTLKEELKTELNEILNYWIKYAQDYKQGGFFGKIDNLNTVDIHAPKGSVLHARILWSFSSAFNATGNLEYQLIAKRAYEYIIKHFIDKDFGGVYWTVTFSGQPLDTKKQVYAIAFTIYALSEFYKANKIDEAKKLAIDLFRLLVEKSYDKEKTGHFEAFTREWEEIENLRLSQKDANEKKTMNTHLHVLEAYSNLYKIWKDDELRQQIKTLIKNFSEHIINKETGNLILFFDENWTRKSTTISYGHDIEASWLLLEAAEIINEPVLINEIKILSIKMAQATNKGIDMDGGLFYEYEPEHNLLIKEKHWWVQAEAMVGFFNAWQISNDYAFLQLCLLNWDFIKDKILDKDNGEWFWGITEDGSPMQGEDKAGLWKCPYHNSRACMEIIRRITENSIASTN